MELTNDEKQTIVNSHLKNCSANLYNLQVTLIAENAVDPVNQQNIDLINSQIAKENSKFNALFSELEKLNNNG